KAVVVTTCANASAETTSVNPQGALLWGMTRAAMEEDPSLPLSLVDIGGLKDLATVINSISHLSEQSACLNGVWLEPQLTRQTIDLDNKFAPSNDKGYL